jgi:hypothetical protein
LSVYYILILLSKSNIVKRIIGNLAELGAGGYEPVFLILSVRWLERGCPVSGHF